MKRSIRAGLTLAPLVLGILLLPAGPAFAKGSEGGHPAASAVISGPGAEPPIVIRGGPVFRMLYLTTFRAYSVGEPRPPSSERLGPSVKVQYFLAAPGGPVRTVTQDLYPYGAGDAVWAFTPAVRPTVWWHTELPASSGWWHSVAVGDLLDRFGLAAAEDGSSATWVARNGVATEVGGDRGALVGAAGIALVLACAITVGAVAGRRKARRIPIGTGEPEPDR